MAMDVLSISITIFVSKSTFNVGGDYIKKAYGIRSAKEENQNDDPIELYFEREFEMVYPKSNATVTNASTQANEANESHEDTSENPSPNVPTKKASNSSKPPKSSKKR
ncbi:hypothetical protein LIER_33966 [Lithospermum erythrorhizon]|uniref:Uncharacterized protein n=1 Tax=Lithospermum erythrorhizon TaxID=34254 RepID=A0AAV3RYA9_LITER